MPALPANSLKLAAISLLLFVSILTPAFAATCNVLHPAPPSDADKALLAADYKKAEDLYRTALAAHPNDPTLTAGLVHALLRQQKVSQAADIAKSALAANPTSPSLLTLQGEVQYRNGEPWLAIKSVTESLKLDPCNPRTMLLYSKIAQLSSYYTTSRRLILDAHRVDPQDPEVSREWIGTLPIRQRIQEIEAYLKSPTGDDPEDILHLQLYLEHLKKQTEEPRKACHLVSAVSSTAVPFQPLMEDATHVSAYGLDVKLNNRSAHLQIDTGAGGILISRATAQGAHLKADTRTEIGGIGDQGNKAGYTAYAGSIRIGNLEFQDCPVSIVDTRNGTLDVDGLIGMDVFSNFLVTLDYPMRRLVLGPLPPRPGESSVAPSLKTEASDQEDDESAPSPETPGAPQSSDAATAKPSPAAATGPQHGPYDRYIAPEMKDYTLLYRVGHMLMLPASLNNQTVKLFVMDTGAWATTISPQAAREVSKLHSDDTEVRGLSGKVSKVYTTGEITFKFAHLAQKVNEVYSFDTSNISKETGLEISGFIGATTLKLLTIHIDYRDGLVKFEYDPNRGYRN